MPAEKRKSDTNNPGEAVTKRIKAGSSTTPASLTEDELDSMSKEELVACVLGLQARLSNQLLPPALTDDQIKAKARQARDLMVKGLKQQTKWTTSCKRGNARYSYENTAEDAKIFFYLFKIEPLSTKIMFKFTPEEFANKVAYQYISGSARYCTLSMQKNVTVRWNGEEKKYSVSGLYGKDQ